MHNSNAILLKTLDNITNNSFYGQYLLPIYPFIPANYAIYFL
jgi:hypothetical protein